MSQGMTENEDDLSDVSIPEESDEDNSETEAETENYGSRGGHISPGRTPSDVSSVDLQHIERNNHRIKASQTELGSFPPEIWQHIFTFTPPAKLGSLLRVSKGFNSLLDPSSLYQAPEIPLTQSGVPRRTPDEVWQCSRKIFRPQMPTPLNGMTELSMWRLMCSKKCAFCKKKSDSLGSAAFNDKWHCGPGENGVRPIWSFGYNSCGPCLRNQTVKEIDLLLSGSVPSALLSALSLILFTNELHVVASTSVHPGQHPPSSMQITKYYLKSDIEEIKKENVKIKELGNATAEEWVKGLSDRGKAKRLDIARWERWEASGGLQRVLKDEPDIIPGTFPPTQPTSLPPRPATFHGYSGLGQPPYAGSAYAPPPGVIAQTGGLPLKFAPGLPQRLDSPLLYGAYAPPGTQKAPRTKEEAERLKLARRTEIERRCSELHPPILPSVLAHMPSFQASLHITKSLDDTAWDMLKPRLLAQRADAEQREKDRLASTQVFQQHQAARQSLNGHPQRLEASVQREWEETQTIVRNRIATYSDEVIRDGWASGTRVTKELCSRFAAEVLIYVRKRFYAEIAKDDSAARAAGVPPLLDPHNGPFTRKLTLDNMRWVYETKIKPHTDQYRKDIFLCNACDTFQWLTFESVCEHYISHHMSYLNSGSTMLNWRAEWPEEPLFNPEPHLARKPKVAASERPTSSNGAAASAPKEAYVPPQIISPLQAASHLSSQSTYPAQGLQAFQPPPFSDPYNPSLISFVSPGPYHLYPPTTQPHQYPGPGGAVYAPFYQHPPTDGYPNPQMPMPQSSLLYNQGYLTATPGDPALIQHQLQQQNMASPLAGTQSHIPPPVYRTEEYKAQLQDMASIARALWNETAGVKDMPGSVRVHVILFHLLQRLRESYTEDPPLSMFVDGIQNAKEMRIVRNVNGIACKTCAKENANKPINPYTVSTKISAPDRKLYSLPQLVNHFQSAHSQASDGLSVPDWRTDMVELPDLRKVQSLKDSADMDEHKLRLLIDALPEAFKPNTPVVHNKELPPSVDKHDSYYQHGQTKNLSPSADKHDSYHHQGRRKGRLPSVDNRDSYYQADRSPTSTTQLDDDVRKLFDPAVDNYPRQGFGHLPSRIATGSIRGPSSMKRKATSPLGNRRVPIQAITADSICYFDPRVVERGDSPHRRMEIEMRPEYNHQAGDLSRLLANTGRAGPGQEHNSLPHETHQSTYQCMSGTERFHDTVAPPESLVALGSSDRTPRTLATADSFTGHDNQRGGCATASEEYDACGDNVQQREGQDGARRSPAGGYPYRPSPEPADPRYVHERTTFVGARTVHSQAPRREPRYADGNRASNSPVYVVEEPPRARHHRAVSPREQRYIDQPRPVIMRVEEDQYGQREQYYQYPEQHVRRRQVHLEPEPEPDIEYVRVRDAAGDYLVARPKPRQQPIYTHYEDDMEPLYEDSRGRAVYEDEYVPIMRVSQVNQRPTQIVYADEAGRGATRYNEDGGEPIVRYEERPQPVVTRVDDGRAPIVHEETPRPQRHVVYEDNLERRQPVYQRRPMNGPPISRDDPAYYEEYDPHNPAPLPEAPHHARRPE